MLPKLIKNVPAKYPPDMRAGMESLYVYCDLCEPQIVGNANEQIIRIVPVHGKHGELQSKVFVAPHYVNVLKKDFASVRISIKTDTDHVMPFQFGKCIIKLHFRKKK
jgi:hypothetical protein